MIRDPTEVENGKRPYSNNVENTSNQRRYVSKFHNLSNTTSKLMKINNKIGASLKNVSAIQRSI